MDLTLTIFNQVHMHCGYENYYEVERKPELLIEKRSPPEFPHVQSILYHTSATIAIMQAVYLIYYLLLDCFMSSSVYTYSYCWTWRFRGMCTTNSAASCG